ncbi:3-hydroxyacyl-ACP dehydratase [Desulfocurvibacter africanus]|uniref:3-hydroxyacyl-ACP dehydratase n=1 Tax=Desulfocurvibacter africanus TaxID=873 RepID=UPI002FDA198D
MNRMRQEILAARLGEFGQLGEAFVGRFHFENDFAGFAGHFPGYPLLPAVVQILVGQIVAEALAQKETGAPLVATAVEKAKFVREVRPGEEVLAECRRVTLKGCAGFEVRLSVNGEAASSFVLTAAQDAA